MEEEGIRPDMPSVIAAREQATFDSTPAYPDTPFKVDERLQGDRVEKEEVPKGGGRKGLPSDLIDEDLMAASDPSLSLKKAFVKSTPAASPAKKDQRKNGGESGSRAYVFSPGKKGDQPKPNDTAMPGTGSNGITTAEPATKHEEPEAENSVKETTTEKEKEGDGETTPTKAARSVPLPESNAVTPTATRPTSPTTAAPASTDPEPSPAPSRASTIDRVAVSPLDPPPAEADYGFQSLAIGGSSIAPPPPSKSPIREPNGWSANESTSPPVSRFGGKGWGALDGDDDGLFGKGGPSVKSDPWGGEEDSAESGWGEPGLASLQSPIAGPSSVRLRSVGLDGADVTVDRSGNPQRHSPSSFIISASRTT